MSAVGSVTPVDSSLSLIMTILNEAAGIAEFLDSVAKQSLLPAEIVIVDGGSTDGTLDVIHDWAVPAGVGLVVETLPGAGISEGRNRAISIASSPRLLVTDAGTTLSPNWVADLALSLRSTDVASGFFEPQRGSFIATAIAVTITPHISEIDPAKFLPSSRSVGFTKAAWAKAGTYPEWLDYCEDLVFDLELQTTGASFSFVPSAIAGWDARPSLKAFAKQYYRYARGDGKAGLWKKRHLIRYAAYIAGVLLVVAAIVIHPLVWVLLVVCAGAYLSKFFRRAVRFRRLLGSWLAPALLMVPVIVVIGDVAKMLGYPAGLSWKRANPTAGQV